MDSNDMSEQKQGQSRAEFEADLIAKAWQDDKFKQQLINNPKAAFEEKIGKKAPDNLKVTVLEETPTQLYFVLPVKPQLEASEELSDEALDAVAGGGGFIFASQGGGYFIFNW
jgi:Nitrile hydratase, alpha chain